MTALFDSLLALLPVYGPWLLALTTFLSCLAVPVPSSLMMIASGAFVGSGDLSLPVMAGAAYAGAVSGDQAGYALGRRAGGLVPEGKSKRAKLIARAIAGLQARGAWAVFLTRWMFSALGPWINLAAGATGYSHRQFTIAGALGEAVWVTTYIGLGIVFGANLEAAAEFASNALGLLAAGAVAAGFGWWLRSVSKPAN